jgi:hypothetical protein
MICGETSTAYHCRLEGELTKTLILGIKVRQDAVTGTLIFLRKVFARKEFKIRLRPKSLNSSETRAE